MIPGPSAVTYNKNNFLSQQRTARPLTLIESIKKAVVHILEYFADLTHCYRLTALVDRLRGRTIPFLPKNASFKLNQSVSSTKRVVAYYTDWSMYGDRPRFASAIPWQTVTDVNYAFMNVDNSGNITLFDPWSDIQVGTDWGDPTKYPYWGNLQMLHQVKLQAKAAGKDLKTYFSVGGWGREAPLAAMASTPQTRATFIESAIKMCETYDFDGIDIDWEYPVGGNDPENFVLLLSELYKAFKAHKDPVTGQPAPLNVSIASAAGPANYSTLNWKAISQSVDWINMMTYDFHGPWGGTSDPVTNHQAPLLPTAQGDSRFNISSAVKAYNALGADMSKICLGAPLYFRSYANVTEGNENSHLYSEYNGTGSGYSPGVMYWCDVMADLKSGEAIGYWDDEAKAFSVYYPATKQFATGVDQTAINAICQYAIEEGLGGMMVWEFKGDDDDCTALKYINQGLVQSPKYPQYENIGWQDLIKQQIPSPSAPPLS